MRQGVAKLLESEKLASGLGGGLVGWLVGRCLKPL